MKILKTQTPQVAHRCNIFTPAYSSSILSQLRNELAESEEGKEADKEKKKVTNAAKEARKKELLLESLLE